LKSPSAVVTDSNHHIFVADPGARSVHIFDFIRSKYSLLEGGSDRLGSPGSLAVDGHDRLYVVDQNSRTILIYDPMGKFRGYVGKLRGGESYFDSPAGIAIDKTTGRIYVCDQRRHMIIVMDDRGRFISKVGTRGGGNRPGEFRLPSQAVVSGDELFVLDAGNTRIQIFDTAGHYRRTINLDYADSRSGLAVDKEGNVYVSDSVLNQIQVFGHDGQRLYTFDASTIGGTSFIRPSGLWVDASDCLYVVDSQSHRVGLFQISGQNARQCR
jgi:DNA-binding beta-propeller fold protein YncE